MDSPNDGFLVAYDCNEGMTAEFAAVWGTAG